MDPKTKDRRILRTRNSLRDALLSLMMEQRYESIALKAILERANIGRSTFYLHYRDKDELLLDGLDRMFEMLRHAQATDAPARRHEKVMGFSLALFQHAYESRDLYRNLVNGSGWDLVRRRIEEMLILLIEEEIRPFFSKKASAGVSLEFLALFLGSALVAVMTWWLNRGTLIPPKEIDSLFHDVVNPTLAAHL